MSIFSIFTKKDKRDFLDKYSILEVQLSYDYNSPPLIKLVCTKILKRDFDGGEYIIESLHSEHIRYFFYPATEEYKDYFIMFARLQKPIQFKAEDFKCKIIMESTSNQNKKVYIKKCIITHDFSMSEKMMTPIEL